MMPEGGKASMRAWAASWECKAKELRLAVPKVSPERARNLHARATFYEAAARAAYEAAYEYGIDKFVKAEKRWLDATRHLSNAEALEHNLKVV